MDKAIKAILTIFILSLLFSAACVRVEEMKEKTVVTPLEQAERATLNLKIGAGELRIGGETMDGLMAGSFRYNVRRWEPEVNFYKSGTRANLRIEQRKSSGITLGRTRNQWDLRFTNKIPLELRLNLGAGEADIDLASLLVQDLKIDMGVGSLTLDLSGDRTLNLKGSIHGGVGSGTIYLPKQVGVRVRVDGGIGSIDAFGLAKSDHTYTNAAYGKTPVSIDLDISAGIGSINLKTK